MQMSTAELDAVKAYMRVDGTDDDTIITALYEAAALYLANAGVGRPADDTALYDLALWSLTLYYYDHRDAVGNESGIPNGLRPILNQLKLLAAADHAAASG